MSKQAVHEIGNELESCEGYVVAQLIQALGYQLDDRRFDSRLT
jgi:hypothetical protein